MWLSRGIVIGNTSGITSSASTAAAPYYEQRTWLSLSVDRYLHRDHFGHHQQRQHCSCPHGGPPLPPSQRGTGTGGPVRQSSAQPPAVSPSCNRVRSGGLSHILHMSFIYRGGVQSPRSSTEVVCSLQDHLQRWRAVLETFYRSGVQSSKSRGHEKRTRSREMLTMRPISWLCQGMPAPLFQCSARSSRVFCAGSSAWQKGL